MKFIFSLSILILSHTAALSQYKQDEGGFQYRKDEIIFKGKTIQPGDKFQLGNVSRDFSYVITITAFGGSQDLSNEFSNSEVEYLGLRNGGTLYGMLLHIKLQNGKKAFIKNLERAFEANEIIIPGLKSKKTEYSAIAPPIFPLKDGFVFYERIDSVAKTKADLYRIAKGWIAENYKDASRVIQLDDQLNGDIVCKGVFESAPNNGDFTKYTLKINCRDGKYRIQMTGFERQIIGNSYYGTPRAIETIDMKQYPTNLYAVQLDNEIKSLIGSISIALSAKADNF